MVRPERAPPRDSHSDDDSGADSENLPLTDRHAKKLKRNADLQHTSSLPNTSGEKGVFVGDASKTATQPAAAPVAAADASALGGAPNSTGPLPPQQDMHSTLPLQPPQHTPAQEEITETQEQPAVGDKELAIRAQSGGTTSHAQQPSNPNDIVPADQLSAQPTPTPSHASCPHTRLYAQKA